MANTTEPNASTRAAGCVGFHFSSRCMAASISHWGRALGPKGNHHSRFQVWSGLNSVICCAIASVSRPRSL